MWSDNILNRAVCGEESRVMFIEGVPPTALRDCLCCEAIKKEAELDIPAFQIDMYSQEASPFCVANPLQVRMELATEIVLCFSSPLSAIGTVFVIVAKTGAHPALFFPTAILQSQGFLADFAGWQLEKREQDEHQSSRQ